VLEATRREVYPRVPDIERDWDDCVQSNDVGEEDHEGDGGGARCVLFGDEVFPWDEILEVEANKGLPQTTTHSAHKANGTKKDEDLQQSNNVMKQ
jgi:hypothetical protein